MKPAIIEKSQIQPSLSNYWRIRHTWPVHRQNPLPFLRKVYPFTCFTSVYKTRVAGTGGTTGSHVFGTIKAGERGKIVIPEGAPEIFPIRSGGILQVVGDGRWGIAAVEADAFHTTAMKISEQTPGE
ncbi:hypothetical protein [Methanoculleus sp. UBA303]|jgi:hypothetical protein|uniref:hypothetical protein n=1 Tax=Methanoculleus sp. UBA303 TaxID=1915497 RepID=UPI0025E9D455|nr:hypothetical protein [Methanoculleus sp. UBA303]